MSLHLEELMEDTDVYSWEKVWAFHANWLNQLEQNRCTWADIEQKLNMRRSLVWHAAMANKASSAASSAKNREEDRQ